VCPQTNAGSDSGNRSVSMTCRPVGTANFCHSSAHRNPITLEVYKTKASTIHPTAKVSPSSASPSSRYDQNVARVPLGLKAVAFFKLIHEAVDEASLPRFQALHALGSKFNRWARCVESERAGEHTGERRIVDKRRSSARLNRRAKRGE
jgi:hypothetical protein